MNRSDLIQNLIARFPQYSAKDIELAVKLVLDGISDTLSRGEHVEIRGFGSYSLNYYPPRLGRNPKTGEQVQVPAKYKPHFRPGKELRERVLAQINSLLSRSTH
jgi:integration host factor subunit beta